jgi:hypothetical protein
MESLLIQMAKRGGVNLQEKAEGRGQETGGKKYE